MSLATTTLGGWGRFPRVPARLRHLHDPLDAPGILARHPALIARGNGRAYGDAAINPACTLSTLRCDRILAFEPETGMITVESGLLLTDLIDFALPRGWFPPVTPGTRLVTIGGMIAADVHGKNHHTAGTFGRHVESFLLLCADGTTRRCARNENTDLFLATCGGMGLTGIILHATFRLLPVQTPWIRQETLRAANLEEAIALCTASAAWPYSVAWIDCLATGAGLGRALIYRGAHATTAEAPAHPPAARTPRRVPCDLPTWTLNGASMRAFNTLYYRRTRPGPRLVDIDNFFYPLDALHDWNRLYGAAGFAQYQCVLPAATSAAGLRAILHRTAAAGTGSFLAVLKLFGPEGEGLLSFPLEGFTLTLDFPVSAATLNLMLELDGIVAAQGGRLYLAKDSRAGAAIFAGGYARLPRFREIRRATDPHGRFASLQSERLGL